MEPRHSTSPPLSSRAILLIGALGFVCLTLISLLAVQSLTPSDEAAPHALQEALAEASNEAMPADPIATDAPLPVVSDVTQASLQSAYDEPVLAELLSFFDAVHVAFGAEGARLAGSMRPYFDDLVDRLMLAPEAYHVKLHAPSLDLAERRASSLQALFLDAGLSADVLTLTGHTGSDGVVVERS